MDDKLREEINRRRTFAIISHPDAGKTTLTVEVSALWRRNKHSGICKGKGKFQICSVGLDGYREGERYLGNLVCSAVQL